MATAHADAWHGSGLRGEHATVPPRRTPPPLPPLPPLPGVGGRAHPSRPVPAEARGRSPERGSADRPRPAGQRGERGLRDDLNRSRPPAPRRPADPWPDSHPAYDDRWADDDARPRRRDGDRPGTRRPPVDNRPTSEQGGRLRGIVAVLGVFLVTLVGGTADWWLGAGLGMITLVALVASTAVATLVVRRRDVITVILSPPLVFVAVAAANVALSPTVSLNLPSIATFLIRGFPTMAAATGAAVLLGFVRLMSRH